MYEYRNVRSPIAGSYSGKIELSNVRATRGRSEFSISASRVFKKSARRFFFSSSVKYSPLDQLPLWYVRCKGFVFYDCINAWIKTARSLDHDQIERIDFAN